MIKKVMGYYYRKSSETPENALKFYDVFDLHKTLEESIRWAEYDKNVGIISRRVKPVFLKVTIEEVEID